MALNTSYTQCCAVKEIHGLSGHDNAKEAMKRFCQVLWQDYPDSPAGLVYGIYTFTGVIKHSDGTKPFKDGKYGPNFAAFIRKNDLGPVSGLISAPNRVNHPTHIVKHWTWAPNVANLKAWYKENK